MDKREKKIAEIREALSQSIKFEEIDHFKEKAQIQTAKAHSYITKDRHEIIGFLLSELERQKGIIHLYEEQRLATLAESENIQKLREELDFVYTLSRTQLSILVKCFSGNQSLKEMLSEAARVNCAGQQFLKVAREGMKKYRKTLDELAIEVTTDETKT